jgi:hypothetical protein
MRYRRVLDKARRRLGNPWAAQAGATPWRKTNYFNAVFGVLQIFPNFSLAGFNEINGLRAKKLGFARGYDFRPRPFAPPCRRAAIIA